MHSLKGGLLLRLFAVFFALAGMPAAVVQAQAQAAGGDVVMVPGATPKELNQAQQDLSHMTPEGMYASPAMLTLTPHSPQGHSGSIWIRSTDEGLHIWGRVAIDESSFHWPREKSEMLSSDHLEVWLATTPDVSMPSVGWGNQFGRTELASLKDCAGQNDRMGDEVEGVKNCEHWYNEQIKYRQYLKRLFVRQWLIGSDEASPHWFEDFASTAYAELNANFFREELPVALQPRSDDGLVVEMNEEAQQKTGGDASKSRHLTGYRFHLFIPYSAFPPARQLKVTDLYLMVDVFSAARAGQKMGEYSSTSPSRRWGDPASFNHLRLASSRSFQVTPCQIADGQRDLYGESSVPWFFPTQPGKDAELRSTFGLINPAGGYMYEPGGVSPEVTRFSYFWKQLKDGATVCGPNLSWRKGNTIKRSEFSVREKNFAFRTLPDGWSLLRSGPFVTTHSVFGSGQCGACPIMNLDLFAVSPKGEIVSALNIDQDLSGESDSPDDAGITMSPDWTSLKLYRQFEGDGRDVKSRWTSTSYCLKGHIYEPCGESDAATPPPEKSSEWLPVDDPDAR